VKPTLVILAAGIGDRYGGLKQAESVGPNGEIIIDYSVYDAVRAGFDRLVFVIRRDFEDEFKHKISGKFESDIETAYVYQELESCTGGFKPSQKRKKPWGTAHAVLAARDLVDKPFVVINADDYYGHNSFKIIADYLSCDEMLGPNRYAMVGYVLRNTLSEYGYVSRGVCECTEQMMLKKIVERIKIEKTNEAIVYFDESQRQVVLTGDEVVSMNFWGFQTTIFDYLQSQFEQFLKERGNDPKAEFFIPAVINNLIAKDLAEVKVLQTPDKWFGITWRQDKENVIKSINKLIKAGTYPEKLW
jgi:UTP-glucose-1-phosphate uridylyltransferase